jgi:hypothetical protein
MVKAAIMFPRAQLKPEKLKSLGYCYRSVVDSQRIVASKEVGWVAVNANGSCGAQDGFGSAAGQRDRFQSGLGGSFDVEPLSLTVIASSGQFHPVSLERREDVGAGITVDQLVDFERFLDVIPPSSLPELGEMLVGKFFGTNDYTCRTVASGALRSIIPNDGK